jgi:hypothetical protein
MPKDRKTTTRTTASRKLVGKLQDGRFPSKTDQHLKRSSKRFAKALKELAKR